MSSDGSGPSQAGPSQAGPPPKPIMPTMPTVGEPAYNVETFDPATQGKMMQDND